MLMLHSATSLCSFIKLAVNWDKQPRVTWANSFTHALSSSFLQIEEGPPCLLRCWPAFSDSLLSLSPCLCRRGWINSAYLLPEEGMATPESTGTRDSHLQLPAPEKHLPEFKLVKFRELLLGKKKKCCILASQLTGRILCGWIAGGSKFIRCVKWFSLSLVIISDK